MLPTSAKMVVHIFMCCTLAYLYITQTYFTSLKKQFLDLFIDNYPANKLITQTTIVILYYTMVILNT